MSAMKYISLLFFAFLLTACSLQGAADDLASRETQARANVIVDQIMAGDFSALETLPDAEGEAFERAVENMRGQVRNGTERARNLVGVKSGKPDGERRSFNLAYEVDTAAGFTVISQTYTVDGNKEPRLSGVNVTGSDESMAAQIRRLKSALKLIGGALLLSLFLIYLTLRRRPKAAEPTA